MPRSPEVTYVETHDAAFWKAMKEWSETIKAKRWNKPKPKRVAG